MNIKFKNVDQGDSILLTWDGNGKVGVGIIDCNIANDGSNPLLEELKLIPFLSTIDFILLSHPHYDHYSGIEEILVHCEVNSIKILRFLHTSSSVPEFLEASVKTQAEAASLASLFKKIDRLYGSVIDDVVFINAASGIFDLSIDWKIEILAPTYAEQRDFNRLISTKGSTTYKSNLLSTILKIYRDNQHILLTSDAEHQTFKRIVMKDFHRLFSKSTLHLGQIPHHGANTNYSDKFWKNQSRVDLCPAAISVGKNSYGHPSDLVIKNLEQLDYKVELTNDVNELRKLEYDLDLISSSKSTLSTDLYYTFA